MILYELFQISFALLVLIFLKFLFKLKNHQEILPVVVIKVIEVQIQTVIILFKFYIDIQKLNKTTVMQFISCSRSKEL